MLEKGTRARGGSESRVESAGPSKSDQRMRHLENLGAFGLEQLATVDDPSG